MKYDYLQRMIEDVKEAIEENRNYWDGFEEMDKDEKADFLNDELWSYDSVTGNGSGSYTFSGTEAKNYVLDNMNLAIKSAKEICCTDKLIEELENEDFESIDVTIRCYLLYAAIRQALNELEATEQ